MASQIFYIHGLGGGVKSATYIGLCKYFADVEILEYPSQTATFSENFKLICDKFYSKYKGGKFLLIGTSLGGFYSSKFAEEFAKNGGDLNNISVLMINPAINPYTVALGLDYPKELVDSYKEVEFSTLANIRKRVILALDDELLDAKQTASIFPSDCVLSFSRGGHSCWASLESDIVNLVRCFL